MPQYLPPCMFHPPDGSLLDSNVPPRPVEPSARFSFKLKGSHGAALVTKYLTYIRKHVDQLFSSLSTVVDRQVRIRLVEQSRSIYSTSFWAQSHSSFTEKIR